MIRCDYTQALQRSVKYARANGMTLRSISIKAGVTEHTVSTAKNGKPTTFATWAAIIMACGFVEIECVLKTKAETL
jgi:hypothetical protein